MDLFNNSVGIELALIYKEIPKKELMDLLVKEIYNGSFMVLKKDKFGRFLDKEGKVISLKELKGKWENNKQLISSNKN